MDTAHVEYILCRLAGQTGAEIPVELAQEAIRSLRGQGFRVGTLDVTDADTLAILSGRASADRPHTIRLFALRHGQAIACTEAYRRKSLSAYRSL